MWFPQHWRQVPNRNACQLRVKRIGECIKSAAESVLITGNGTAFSLSSRQDGWCHNVPQSCDAALTLVKL